MKKENKISRLEFLKSIGVSAAALAFFGSVGAAEAGEFIFEETTGDIQNRPWWVRNVTKPTTEIDWKQVKRFNAYDGHVLGHGWYRYFSEATRKRLNEVNAQLEAERIEGQVPGYELKDYAIYNSFEVMRELLPNSFLGPREVIPLSEKGAARWQGTPDQAARMLKAAMRQMGAASIGIVHLDDNTRKLIYAVDIDGKKIEFENVTEAYENNQKRVIPYKCEWAVVYTVQMAPDGISRSPTIVASTATSSAYLRGMLIQLLTQAFLRSLGYQALGEVQRNALAIGPAFGVMAGLGELSRQNRLITPEYGPLVRIFVLLTDLPLADDSPIDAGITDFCKVCKKCAEACPPGAISFETEPFWQPVGDWNSPGHKAWFEDGVKCYTYWKEGAGKGCSICFAVCPFTKKDKSFLEKFIKMQIALNPNAGRIIRSFDDAFGYGVQKEPETWWDLDLPEYGIDTTTGKSE